MTRKQSVSLGRVSPSIIHAVFAYLPLLSAAVNAESYLQTLLPASLQIVASTGVAGGL
jgi:hypothetical protein